MNTLRNTRLQEMTETGFVFRDDLTSTPKRQAWTTAVDAFRARLFYIDTPSPSAYEVIYYNAGVEVIWLETTRPGIANAVKDELNTRLSQGWVPPVV